MRRSVVLLVAPLLGWACAEDADSGGVPLSLTFMIAHGSDSIACKDQPGITEVEARLTSPNTGTSRSGFPRPADCESGTFEATADSGDHIIELAALGPLGADPRATLFLAHSAITLPSDAPIRLSLAPQVAFLELAWDFGNQAGATCPEEVDHLALTVTAAGSQSPTFSGRIECGESPRLIPAAFDLTTYTIDLRAVSADGAPLYVHSASRLFNRGNNQYTATLAPRGGRLYLDWDFTLDQQRIRACGDPSVAVDSLTIKVLSREGDQPVEEQVPCSASRPYAFRNGRFQPSRQLTLELVADGAAHFSESVPFTMPQGDYHSEVISLKAKGDVDLTINVATATCAPMGTRFDLKVYTDDRQPTLVAETTLTAADEIAHFSGLEYGRYYVHLLAILTEVPRCMVSGLRSVEATEQTWETLEL